jgi:hypothetical protein
MSNVRGPKVFITYRREETGAHAGRLYDAMAARYGDQNVFMDVEMAPGVDFVERITESVAACQVLIVVMGPRWATLEDEQGRPRLADPEDFVRLEVETALRRPEVTPIPVLVAGAQMPNREDLPPELHAITRRNALELSDRRWRNDVGRLISTVDGLVGEMAATQATPPAVASSPSAETKRPPGTPRGSRVRWVLLGLMAAAAIVVAVIVASGGGSEGTSEETTDYQALLELIPSGIRPSCKDRRNAHWMVEPGEATAQTLCANPEKYYLSYGLWRSPLEAQDWVVNGARDQNTLECAASTLDEIKRILPAATTGCEDKPDGHKDGPGIVIWWSKNGSRVGTWFDWPGHDQAAALKQWRRLATSG